MHQPHQNIPVLESLLKRFNEEFAFQKQSSDRDMGDSKSAAIRILVDSYISRWWPDEMPCPPPDNGLRKRLSIYLNNSTASQWVAACEAGCARNRGHLIELAIADYFKRQEAIAANVRSRIGQVKDALTNNLSINEIYD